MSQLPKPQVDQLQAFVSLLEAKPDILHDPALAFFRDYLIGMGATIPPAPKVQQESPTEREKSPEPEEIKPNKDEAMEQDDVEEEPESDIELDMTGVIGKLHNHLGQCTSVQWLSFI